GAISEAAVLGDLFDLARGHRRGREKQAISRCSSRSARRSRIWPERPWPFPAPRAYKIRMERIFVALDTTDAAGAEAPARRLKGLVGGVKLGKEFFTANGPAGVARIGAIGMPVFLDLKFHDIPNTVAGAVRASLAMRPFMLNVHAAGGEAMMRAAAEAAS